jgi:hypothetical protein
MGGMRDCSSTDSLSAYSGTHPVLLNENAVMQCLRISSRLNTYARGGLSESFTQGFSQSFTHPGYSVAFF